MDTRKSNVPKSPSGIPQEYFEAQLRQQQEKNQPFVLEPTNEDDSKTKLNNNNTNFSNLNVSDPSHDNTSNHSYRRNKSRSPSPGHHHRKIKSPGYYPIKKEGMSSFRKIDEKETLYRPHDAINLDNSEINEKMWQLMSTYLRKDVPTIERHIVNHIEYTLARTRYNFDNFAAYQATALSIRDRLIESWNDTQQYFTIKNVKRVYYLSMEFLMGRSLQNAIINMGLKDVYSQALNKMGHSLESLYDEEKDAALGNGGLGRLAACFMDSLATMDFPAWGYGIRYTYGMFQQQIIDGYQVEFPDYWLTFGNPWEIERLDVFYPIQFYGKVSQYTDARGQTKHRWDGGETVFAVAYDTPVPGYDTFNCLNLRLWSSKPSKEFDLASFNSGDYYRAIETKQRSENITSVLYPNDNTYKGKELRLKQQYFFSSATLRDIVRRFKKTGKPLSEIPSFVAIQLNDTHPSISIAEMMRIMMDEEGLSYKEAWEITTNTFAYTNHTVLPEALEKWSVDLMENLLPRHLAIIYEINWNFLEEVKSKFPNDNPRLSKLSIVEEGPTRWIRMANLAIIGSHAVNGVAEIHSNILKESVFKEFFEMWPSKFQNKTNGVTPRRWVGQANPSLSKILTEWSETDDWIKDMYLLNKLEQHSTNPKLQKSWLESKLKNKQRLADYVAKVCSVSINPNALFDVMVKRIHEYKRQFLNILGVIARYNFLHSLTEEERKKVVPRVFFFGGKAAPGYMMAKKVIKLINSVAEVVNKDNFVNEYLKIVYIPNYNVSLAEIIIPGSDISEHISTAGTEASGTSNMKFAMNGSLVIGTLDGANVEIRDEIGDENIFIFGAKKEEVESARAMLRSGKFEMDTRLQRVIEMISRGVFGSPDIFEPLINTLKPENDYYLLSYDFPSYMAAQEEVDNAWKNQKKWLKMSIESTARTGKFNSDRTIAEYANDIWNVKPCPRPNPNQND